MFQCLSTKKYHRYRSVNCKNLSLLLIYQRLNFLLLSPIYSLLNFVDRRVNIATSRGLIRSFGADTAANQFIFLFTIKQIIKFIIINLNHKGYEETLFFWWAHLQNSCVFQIYTILSLFIFTENSKYSNFIQFLAI